MKEENKSLLKEICLKSLKIKEIKEYIEESESYIGNSVPIFKADLCFSIASLFLFLTFVSTGCNVLANMILFGVLLNFTVSNVKIESPSLEDSLWSDLVELRRGVEKTLDQNILSKGMLINYFFGALVGGITGIIFSYVVSVFASIAIFIIVDIPNEQNQYVMDESFFYVSYVSSIFSAVIGVYLFIQGTRKTIGKIKLLKKNIIEKKEEIERLSLKLKEKIVEFDLREKDFKLAKIEMDSIYSAVEEYAKADGFSKSDMRKFFKTDLEIKTEKENDETKIKTIKETLGKLRTTDIEMTNLGENIDYGDILIFMNRIFSFTLMVGTITMFMGVTGLLFSSLPWSVMSVILILILALSIKQYFELKTMVKHLDNDYKLDAIKSNKKWAARHKQLRDLQNEKIMLLKKIKSEVNDLSNVKEGLFKKEWDDFLTFSR
tara:strand:+ start:47135 stop:48436 length:1302 start_codon:yes stop_codon:yes gene_type:complete